MELAGLFVGWLVGWSVGRLIHWSLGWSVGRLSNPELSFIFDILIAVRLPDCLVGRHCHSEDRRKIFSLYNSNTVPNYTASIRVPQYSFPCSQVPVFRACWRVLVCTPRLSQIAFSNILLRILNSPTWSLLPPGFHPEVLACISYVLGVLYTSAASHSMSLLIA
jgi:hypothetical protein